MASDRTTTVTCVIADDHALMRKAVGACLRADPGLDLIGEADDGQALLELIERRRPDIVVVDAHMPKVDGIGVCRAVSQRFPETRVVLYTGDEEIELLESALEAGACGFVVKSGPPTDLIRAIDIAMDGRVYIDSSLVGSLLARREHASRNPLSPRELEVLGLLAEGHTTADVAQQLFLSPATVRTYAENAMHKVDARNRLHLVAKALRMGLLR